MCYTLVCLFIYNLSFLSFLFDMILNEAGGMTGARLARDLKAKAEGRKNEGQKQRKDKKQK
jgi:hypothetical protein